MTTAPPLHVLMLEDSPLDAELIEEHLHRGGIAVDIQRVSSRNEFVAAIEHSQFQLVLADYNLPGFDGLSALKIAAKKAPTTPFILVSGTLTEEAAIEAMRNGASDFVVKQRLNRLPDAVQRALNEVGEREARRIAEGLLERSNQSLSRTIETLERREEQLRLATDAAEIGTWDLDIATNTLTWSVRTKAAFGISPDASSSMTDFYNGLHPDDLETTSQAFASALDPEVRATYDVEYRTVGKEDGVVRWVAAKGKGLFDSAGNCVRAIGTAIDITGAKRAQVRQSLMAELTDLLRSEDPEGALDVASKLMGEHFGVQRVGYGILDSAADVFRYTVCWTDGSVPPLLGEYPAQAFGDQIVARLNAGETVVVADLFADAISNQARTLDTAAEVDTRAILVVPFLRSGRLRTIVYLNTRLPRNWTASEVTFMETVAQRICQLIERADADAAIRSTAERYRLAAKATNDPIWDWDLQTNHVLWNDALFDVFGFSADDVLPTGDWWLDHIAQGDRDRISESIHAAIDGEDDHWTAEYCFLNADGRAVPVLDRGYVIRDGQGKALRMIGAMLDLTERRRTEELLRESNDRLEERVQSAIAEREAVEQTLRQAQKMEAVGQLTGGIAHDFNNMLAVTMGSLELMKRRIPAEDARTHRYIESALEGCKRSANLTQRLLAFSRQQNLSPKTLDVNKLVANMSELLRHSIGADVQLETVLAGGLWHTHVDPNQLENVILNLAVNARDAMDTGGHLTIETQNAHLDSGYASSELGITAGQYVLVAVSDTGTGMPPEIIEKAFDPFFTTKDVGKGTGLGLSQVYGFVKQSGGHVKIYSEPGQGTTIKIYLPRDTKPAIEPVKETQRSGIQGEAGELIMVVDDEPAVRRFTCEALIELGYGVIEVATPSAAIQMLKERSDVALLFSDIVMPETNGFELVEQSLKIRPELKILHSSGYTRNSIVRGRALDAHLNLITKPFSIDELAARVREVLDR
ncbi:MULTISPECIES: PAS domain-containing protein [Asticcacaulis]|uniref:PAS domain-containing protein n=1 Tax=Asticcacaulis TaxID=76890 RepID=UPI001AE32B5A|nr:MULTISPECIES: PAS domain-containing protein [Asticcacaulis]MBP2157471.1 PAS domain S-box-containing protein [Asticcacaulis solisilvae]MDR6798516.1 PAS domain S-box-containing protein [Asticcacaulis sp. BE141]